MNTASPSAKSFSSTMTVLEALIQALNVVGVTVLARAVDTATSTGEGVSMVIDPGSSDGEG